uniref:Uncharacterized protein n=1 Tax=Panagrolaimus sp. JU765 TaxID=591449 RepID=A0AC34PZM8_9BILA
MSQRQRFTEADINNFGGNSTRPIQPSKNRIERKIFDENGNPTKVQFKIKPIPGLRSKAIIVPAANIQEKPAMILKEKEKVETSRQNRRVLVESNKKSKNEIIKQQFVMEKIKTELDGEIVEELKFIIDSFGGNCFLPILFAEYETRNGKKIDQFSINQLSKHFKITNVNGFYRLWTGKYYNFKRNNLNSLFEQILLTKNMSRKLDAAFLLKHKFSTNLKTFVDKIKNSGTLSKIFRFEIDNEIIIEIERNMKIC